MVLGLDKISPHLSDLPVGPNSKAKVVIYGLGSIEFNYNSQVQLALFLLLKDRVDWMGEIEIYDPVMSTVDMEVYGIFGLKALHNDENGRRKAQGPTMFYMPSPSYFLLGNILEANWSSSSLEQIFLLTNSLEAMEEVLPSYDQFTVATRIRLSITHLFRKEIPIPESSDCQMYPSLFLGFGWHFFKGVKNLPVCIWLYRQRYFEMVIKHDFKSKKISKEFKENLAFIRYPRDFRMCALPHQVGWFKLNIYGIGRKEGELGRYGGVFKDEGGNCLTKYCYKFESNFEDDVIAGLASLKYGLTLVKPERLIVESDNIMLVHYVNGRLKPNEIVKVKLEEIFELLTGITYVVYHVYEDANKVAREWGL
ncbi:hypothetical protein EJD97_005380 [Solanum chilense]|uniref:RNase H type-1 domain-containing protein n=1 Tax=Solanum chilense TaxID=4083 RepID=A0A6N2BSG4_SOLCI|nr:hypothetical protein EJD97_005380 [Solanum chilense]